VALKRKGDPVLDLVEGRRRFRKKRVEIHVDPLKPRFWAPLAPATRALDIIFGVSWLTAR
jgi:hypothetical protein